MSDIHKHSEIGNCIIVKVDSHITISMRDRFSNEFKKAFPDKQILVIPANMEVSLIKYNDLKHLRDDINKALSMMSG